MSVGLDARALGETYSKKMERADLYGLASVDAGRRLSTPSLSLFIAGRKKIK
jgi:hypothetical protein